jgi:hemerythrin-like metal-binding protein
MGGYSKPVYGAGNANLDRDHSILLQLVDELKEGRIDPVVMADTGRRLLAYLDAHFEHEEELMDRFHYPDAAAHKEAHSRFRADAVSLISLYANSEADGKAILRSLRRWVETHVCDVDARLGCFLREHGVEKCGEDTGIFDEAGLG